MLISPLQKLQPAKQKFNKEKKDKFVTEEKISGRWESVFE